LRRFAETELAPRYREPATVAELPLVAHKQLADLRVLAIGPTDIAARREVRRLQYPVWPTLARFGLTI
jgi:hypothetical protein